MVNKKSNFYNKRLGGHNIENYLLEKFPGAKEVKSISKKVIDMDAFCQRNLGGATDGDCTLTSLTTIIYYHCKKEIDHRAIYSVVRN
jgi:hypothetical protein